MSTRISRPWDRKGINRFEKPSSSSSSESVKTVTSVKVDGVAFWSDRFYLNRAVGDAPASTNTKCICGARSPPPLLDRARLVASLQLKAAIVATYTLDPKYMCEELASLFGPQSNVPTLVLHGHKGFCDRKKENTSVPEQQSQSPDRYSETSYEQTAKRRRKDNQEVVCIDDSSDDEDNDTNLKSSVCIKEEEPPEEAALRFLESGSDQDVSLGPLVHLTEILTTWLPPDVRHEIDKTKKMTQNDNDRVIALDSDDDEDDCGVDPLVVKGRLKKRGVHHPKFMILFETSGSVVVVVSTSNLTREHAVDASWVQRFEQSNVNNHIPREVTDATRCDGSDFGHVLANYLGCQSRAAKEGQMIPEVFLRKHMDMCSLGDFVERYRFEDSHVHLIATVPGEYVGRKYSSHLGNVGRSTRTFLYGSQRVNDIAHRLSSGASSTGNVSSRQSKPWLPRALMSDEDRLVIQPTSFGGFWTQDNLTDLVRLYLEDGVDSSRRCEMLLAKADVIWPSLDYMNEVCSKGKKQSRTPSPDSVVSAGDSDELAKLTPGRYCFLSSISFNTIDLACLSRMFMFESAIPSQIDTDRPPHIKSYARIFEGDEYQVRKEYAVEKAQEYFSWFMLTSACLSRGAQGEAVSLRGFESDEMTYSNFELGVLFVSRLRGVAQSDRLYCFRPNQCNCGLAKRSPKKPRAKMIHLPIPYSLRPQPYHVDEEDAEMCVTPYFHEIPERSGVVGQMRLTPLGAQLAAAEL